MKAYTEEAYLPQIKRRIWLYGLVMLLMTLVLITLFVGGLMYAGEKHTAGRTEPPDLKEKSHINDYAPDPPREVTKEEKAWGIQIVGLRLTGANYMFDFRYRVTDPKKAAPLLEKRQKPYLIDQKTGGKYLVPSSPKVGPLRQTTVKPEKGRIYYMLFANPGRTVLPGRKMSVVIGNLKIENIVVQ